MHDNVTARFWAKVDQTGDCWTWQGSTSNNGYGHAWIGKPRRTTYAHRRAWELTIGPIPSGMNVLHHCDNPPCVRPDHLFLGTQADNGRDMMAKGRGGGQMGRGPANPNTLLTVDEVRAIRVALKAGDRTADIARRYGVRPQTIDAIAIGRSWRWLDAA